MGEKINEGFLVPLETHPILQMSQGCAIHISHQQCFALTLLLAFSPSRMTSIRHRVC